MSAKTPFRVVCSACGREYEPESLAWKCECGAPLDVELDLEHASFELEALRNRVSSMWRYIELIPLLDSECVVSMGEGYTPMLSKRLGGVEVCLKLDYVNPTGSFKDRGASAMISNLKALGVREVAVDSSGNAGAAIAAYSAAAGMRCRVFVPASAPLGKKIQIASYGAKLVEVKGSRERVHEAVLRELGGAVYASHMWNPFFIEGLKTLAYEYVEQVEECPDAALLPVGSGGLLLGVYKGFRELRELGVTSTVPRILAVQAAGFTPVYEALHGPYRARASGPPLADGIAIPRPPRLTQIIEAVRESGGDAVVVEDHEILEAFKELARMGLFVEPTSATALAALWKALDQELVDRGETVYIPLTGIGLKATDKLAGLLKH